MTLGSSFIHSPASSLQRCRILFAGHYGQIYLSLQPVRWIGDESNTMTASNFGSIRNTDQPGHHGKGDFSELLLDPNMISTCACLGSVQADLGSIRPVLAVPMKEAPTAPAR